MKITTALFSIFIGFQLNAAILYVSPTGSGTFDGSSWTNAISGNMLQNTITSANAGDEVWVAAGTYFPSANNRSAAFSMKNGVAIYGSFAGTETLLSQRNLANGLTSILSGEIGLAGISDNSYHVISNVNLDLTAIIDGFIIRDANDDRTPNIDEGLGGGIYNDGSGTGDFCNPTIRNCLITENQAVFGAGIFNNGYDGGNASPQIINCIITDNYATSGGGGIDNFGLLNGNASPTFVNCVISNNQAANRAGGMYCWGGNNGNASPTLMNTTFVNNSAIDGGGIVADRLNASTGSSGTSSPNFVNCILWGNTASGVGPQFFTLGDATLIATYSDVDLTNQSAPHVISGAGTGNINSNPMFENITSGVGLDGNWFTEDDGFQLVNSSPCVNSGTNSGVTSLDILGENRVHYTTVDMGAYEFYSTVGMNEYQQDSFEVYPNPTVGFIELSCDFPTDEKVQFSVYDVDGKKVLEFMDFFALKGHLQLPFDCTSLKNGMYFLAIESNSFKSVKQFIKQ